VSSSTKKQGKKGAGKGSKGRMGRPLMLAPEQVAHLVQITEEQPHISMDDLVYEFRRRTGITISRVTAGRYLERAGVQRLKPSRAKRTTPRITRSSAPPPVEPGSPGEETRYGYTEAHRDPGDATRYPCGLTDSEWERVQHIFDPPGRTGCPPKYPRRQMLDGCIYLLRSGCSWRMLPKEFPPWKLVYTTFRRWQSQGLFERMHDELRGLWRERQHRNPEPTAAVLDSQSVRTSPQGGPSGYDGAKKVKGRKRHLVTDTLGLVLAVVITTADVQDRDGAEPAVAVAMAKYASLQKLYVDGGYSGRCTRQLRQAFDLDVEVVRHPGNRNVGRWVQGQMPLFDDIPTGFVVLPKRWVVERTNAWNSRPRRMARDYDRSLAVSEAWIWLTEARLLLRRLDAPMQDVA